MIFAATAFSGQFQVTVTADDVEKCEQYNDAVDPIKNGDHFCQWCAGCEIAVSDGGQGDYHEIKRIDPPPPF
jgi:hypothetical protein